MTIGPSSRNTPTLQGQTKWCARRSVELNSVALAENSVSRADQKCNVIMHGAKPADLPVAGANQVRFRHQPQDCQDARPHDAVRGRASSDPHRKEKIPSS